MSSTASRAGLLRPRIKTVIVEDEGLYRGLLSHALCAYPDIHIIATFPDSDSATEEIPLLRPDVALLDIQLQGKMNGIQLGAYLRERLPNLGIVLLSNYRDPCFLTALRPEEVAGWSYLLKRSVADVATLYRAVKGSIRGEIVLDPQLTENQHLRYSEKLGGLSAREFEILSLIAQGYSNAAIAAKLFLSPRTVENRIRQLYQRLEIDTSSSAFRPRVLAVLRYLHAIETFQG